MVLDPIPQSLPVHFFGSRPQPPTSLYYWARTLTPTHRLCEGIWFIVLPMVLPVPLSYVENRHVGSCNFLGSHYVQYRAQTQTPTHRLCKGIWIWRLPTVLRSHSIWSFFRYCYSPKAPCYLILFRILQHFGCILFMYITGLKQIHRHTGSAKGGYFGYCHSS